MNHIFDQPTGEWDVELSGADRKTIERKKWKTPNSVMRVFEADDTLEKKKESDIGGNYRPLLPIYFYHFLPMV